MSRTRVSRIKSTTTKQKTQKSKKMSTEKHQMATVIRQGTQIIIPEKMSYATARDWITKQETAEEQVVKVNEHMLCFPLDGLVALRRAAERIYGFYSVEARGFWGEIQPAQMVPVELWGNDKIDVPYAAMKIPTWEGGQLQPIIQGEMKLWLVATVKRKFEAEVNALIAEAKKELKENSIYKGKAVSVRLDFLDPETEVEFHPVNSAPKFMNDVVHVTEDSIILNDVTKFEVATNIYSLIEQTEAMRKNKIPLKHGAVFAGPYGTGKTFLGKVIAGKAVKHGWTFIYLEDIRQIAAAIKFAQTYAPAVIFGEDVDQVTSGSRNADLNQILNTIDGIDTKSSPIITILTTNHPEKITPGFMRAGRVDSFIVVDKPDEFAAQKFVKLYAGDALAEGTDLAEVGKELANMSPAFIAESIQKAKRHALYRTGDANITGQVTANDLLLSAKAMSKHIRMAEMHVEKSPAEQVLHAHRILSAAQNPTVVTESNGDYEVELKESLASLRSVN